MAAHVARDRNEIVHRFLPSGAEFHVGDDLNCELLFVIMEGWVKTCSVRSDGRMIIFGFHCKGDAIPWEPDLEAMFIGALSSAHLCGLTRKFLQRVGRADGAITSWVNERLISHSLKLQAHIALLGERQSVQRLLSFLHLLARNSVTRSLPADLQLNMTREDIAHYLQLSPETVSRSFTWLHDHRHLQIKSPRVIRLMPQPAAIA